MTLQLFAFTCGSLTVARADLLEGGSGRITVPVPAYLIVHDEGNVLFDTGLHVGMRQHKAHFLAVAQDESFDFDLPEGCDIAAQLGRLGIAPSAVRYVVNSHLHYDHCGGNAAFPGATFIVHEKEWRAGHHPGTLAAGIYDPANYNRLEQVRQIGGELDLFGDGAVVVFPTPGHTPGHQSLRLALASGPVVLAADCCYLKQTLDALHLPTAAYNRAQMLESLGALRRLQEGGARIFYGHDPDFWKTVPQAPAAMT